MCSPAAPVIFLFEGHSDCYLITVAVSYHLIQWTSRSYLCWHMSFWYRPFFVKRKSIWADRPNLLRLSHEQWNVRTRNVFEKQFLPLKKKQQPNFQWRCWDFLFVSVLLSKEWDGVLSLAVTSQRWGHGPERLDRSKCWNGPFESFFLCLWSLTTEFKILKK